MMTGPNVVMHSKRLLMILKKFYSKNLPFKIFNICFQKGITPLEWDKADILPRPIEDKNSRAPLNNRPISIICCIAKLYSGVLNERLQEQLESNELLSDTRNGLRAARSCIEHMFVLITVLRNRCNY